MANEDMEGKYFGGGDIRHAVQDGMIYLNAGDIVQLFIDSGADLADYGLDSDDELVCEQGRTMMILAYKINELNSELLNREIMKSL